MVVVEIVVVPWNLDQAVAVVVAVVDVAVSIEVVLVVVWNLVDYYFVLVVVATIHQASNASSDLPVEGFLDDYSHCLHYFVRRIADLVFRDCCCCCCWAGVERNAAAVVDWAVADWHCCFG
jgi:hypothetical protein